MIVSRKVTSDDRQLWLFDEPLGGHGHVRYVLGDLAERLTARLVGGTRHVDSSTAWYCPDVSVGDCYFEVKSSGRSGEFFVYEGRLLRDRLFASLYPLAYVIWEHNLKTVGFDTVPGLQAAFFSAIKAVWLVPFSEVSRHASKRPPVKLNSKYGGKADRSIYGQGRRIRINDLRDGVHVRLERGE